MSLRTALQWLIKLDTREALHLEDQVPDGLLLHVKSTSLWQDCVTDPCQSDLKSGMRTGQRNHI